jgi:hypothetical protein
MTEVQQAILTSCLTVCSGVLVLVAGQIVIRFLLDPLTELRKLLGEVSDSLTYYAHVYSNPGVAGEDVLAEAKRVLRQRASQLWAKALSLPLYAVFSFLHLVPSRKSISEASANLIGLSNSVYRGDAALNTKRAIEIREALGLQKE